MLRHTFAFALLPLALLTLVSTDAGACCSQRTFVASTGNDANPCTVVAPCRSFAAALGQTESHGEIIVLDSAGYGPVTIPNPISITAPPGIYAGITVVSGDGITVVTGSSSKVVLRGLTINGEGGQNGINFVSGQGLQIHDCVVSDMAANGIQLEAPGSTVLVTGTLVRQSLQSGIYLQGTQVAVLDGVRAEGNRYGVYARSGPSVTIRNSVVVNSFSGGGFNLEASSADSTMTISNSVSSSNSGHGVAASGNVSSAAPK